MATIEQILGADARALLDHRCQTIPKESLHLPGPDFVERLHQAAWLTPPASDATPLVIVLEGIQDPGYLGSMLRSGAADGATLAVLSIGCYDPWSPKALRGGQGAQFELPLLSGVDIVEWLAGFEGESLALAPAEDHGLYARSLSGPLALIVGNEGGGLSQVVCAAASATIRIPMHGRIESLNAAAALAVAVFEAARQRAA